MEQNTKEWLDWRRQGIGASDAPAIMGISPYTTPYKLWLEKIGKEDVTDDEEKNYVLEKGKELEPLARDMYEHRMKVKASPKLVEYETYPFVRASLDGFYDDVVVEIKYVGKSVWRKGDIVPHHYPQLQHQILCTNASRADCVLYNDEVDDIKIVSVKPHLHYMQKQLLPKEIQFWESVKLRIPPPLSDKDTLVLDLTDSEVTELIRLWEQNKKKLDAFTKLDKELKEKITAKLPHPKVKLHNIGIYKIEKKGNVDYKAIPELLGVNLEPYRKPGSTYYKFDVR